MKSLHGCMMLMEKHKPYIAMIFVQIVYSGMALLSKLSISEGMSPYVLVSYRQGCASLFLAPFAYFLESNKSAPMSFNLLCKIFLMSLCGPTMSLNLYCLGLNYTSATFATATGNTIPAVTFILASLLRMESIKWNRWHGIAKVMGSVLGVTGAMLYAFVKGSPVKFVNWPPKPSLHSSTKYISEAEWVKGALIMFSSVLTWSLWLIFTGPIIKQYPAKIRLTTLQCFFSCVQSLMLAAAVARSPSAWTLGWNINLVTVAYCGIVVTGITYWLQVWAIEKKGPVFTSMFSPLALFLTALFSTIAWKEALHWGSIGAIIMLIGGLYSFLWGKKREEDEINAGKQERKEEATLECITHQ